MTPNKYMTHLINKNSNAVKIQLKSYFSYHPAQFHGSVWAINNHIMKSSFIKRFKVLLCC